MMASSTKIISFVVAALLSSFATVTSFQVQQPRTLNAAIVVRENAGKLCSQKEDHLDGESRRSAAAKLMSAAAASTASLLVPKIVNAEDVAGGGKLIEFMVENLDGEAGKTGRFVIKTRPEWAPKGAARFEELTEKKFWDGCRIFRVLPGFVSQFGINGDPTTQSYWRSKSLSDDPVKVSNTRGTVVFATAGPNTRTTQIFINTGDRNSFLDRQGFSPIGEVVEGMDIVDRFYSGYGEGAPSGKGPNQGLIQAKGNEYLEKGYPKLSFFSKVSIVN